MYCIDNHDVSIGRMPNHPGLQRAAYASLKAGGPTMPSWAREACGGLIDDSKD